MTDEIIRRIKQRAAQFCVDNYRHTSTSDRLVIENAMLIGALIVGELEMEELKDE